MLLTKFNWALSKLPFSLIDSIGSLCKRPASYRDPYQELQDILLHSYSLSASQTLPEAVLALATDASDTHVGAVLQQR
jgi:hypothetical protein